MQSDFYTAFTSYDGGNLIHNIFATTDLVWHKRLKSAVAPTYTLSNLRKLETLVDECTEVFLKDMEELENKPLDLGMWVQWYAFDVIGNLTFGMPFGFLREKADKNAILDSLEIGFVYNTLVGQAPWLHAWLLGNNKLMALLSKIPSVAKSDPMATISKVMRCSRCTIDMFSHQLT